ncbi:fatty acid desaturase-domain-containing protein [Lasiosphaeria ovina]|uniref:Fatty acid desaturase-domain-containing protein n=1 Tax=Lasiosphaeria ovina TaxID=92902 RepID=A0AAE0TUP0_9PEZI|nr:fatty acid desaturase-domain-containing protein [Lasiosphaeria ovina]
MATTTATQTTLKGRTAEAKLALQPSSAEQQYPDIQTIRDAIPAHCFKASTARSLGYLVRDVAMIGVIGWAGLTYIPTIENTLWRTAAWIVYGYVQGLVCTGLWILAHECGHGGFSAHQRFNDVVGWAAHSALLVPYFSWKFSHHRHHRFTGHMEKDMAFVPQTKADRFTPRLANLYMDPEMFEDTPIVQLVKLLSHQLAGWQMYLLFNVSAGPKSKQRESAGWLRVSHFEPTSSVFRPSEAIYIALSDLGLAITAYGLYLAANIIGWQTLFLLYGVPYFWVHHWLVAITYLHHTHPDVPHFDAENWTFVKGALATVDRDFGFVGRHLFHGIIDTHVVHHLFPRIPFYRAEEATEALKPLLGSLYHRESGSFIGSLWSTFGTCKYVEADPAVPGELKWATKST